MDLKVGRSLGCYCTAEGNEYLNWRDSNGDGKKRDDGEKCTEIESAVLGY